MSGIGDHLLENLKVLEKNTQPWIILIDGKRFVTSTNRSVWSTKNAAHKALLAEAKKCSRDFYYSHSKALGHARRIQDAHYLTGRLTWSKGYQQWKKEHIQVIQLNEEKKVLKSVRDVIKTHRKKARWVAISEDL